MQHYSRHGIIGAAAGYHYGDVLPFLLSLERCGFHGHCYLFVSDTTRDQERMDDLARSYALHRLPLHGPDRLDHLPCNALRHFLSLELLQRQVAHLDQVLLTDVRDVIFQHDPFSFAWGPGLHAVLEHRAALLGKCPHNSRWVRDHLGAAALETIAHCPVSCSGTTLGDTQDVLDYLERLTSLLLPYEPARFMAGYDQGVHNYLIHGTTLPNLTLHDNSGPVLTLATRPGEPLCNEAGEVLNDAGVPAHVVHQYDRKPHLFRSIRARFQSAAGK
ncbi:hypothetical protein SAMN02745704_00171 [Paucidesulfovibrio gracilis DSM 16080]|uniref:Uncharacterized protein n=1 Tax=Paucidesulfovibrio gracilis DSM 16080 TaxID=1121449 RepID=A0A1T4W3F4_9BACT|nr:hypothetical protein [Paucidesulfovibrio gracilis]SKA71598.1 hypothetical protein SAMN02745704_00171 [Paucidesulfovibrio gracilis DSM 16080]